MGWFATLRAEETAVLGANLPQNLPELVGSADNLRIIRDASAVQACSVKSPVTASKDPNKTPDVYRPSDRGPFVALNHDQAAALKKLLLDERNYAFDALESFCLPHYTIRAEFKSGEKVVAANFCFGCRNLLYSQGRKSLGSRDLKEHAADELFDFFRQVFPNDPDLIELARHKAASKN